MERRWLYIALVSLGCLELRQGHAESAEQAPDTMEARVMACAPCHGAMGEGTNNAYFPRLAGKPAGYLANQLHAFHTGRRHFPPMNYLLAYLPDDYLKQIAEYFAAQRPPLPTPAVPSVSNDVLERGESIVTAWRRGGRHTCLFELPRPASHRDGARNSRPSGIARELYQRSARRMALWDSHRGGARLHADRRRSSDGGGRQGDRRLPRRRGRRRLISRPRPRALSLCRLPAGVSRNDSLRRASGWLRERSLRLQR